MSNQKETQEKTEYFKVGPTLNPQIITFDKIPNLVSNHFAPKRATGLHKTDIKLLIGQYLHEHGYSETLKCFQKEGYFKYDQDLLKMGGQLENIILEYGDLQELTEVEEKENKKEKILSVETQEAQEDLLKEGDKTWINHCQNTLKGIHSANILSISWSHHQESLLATGSSDKNLKIWENEENILTLTPHEGAIISLDWNPNKELLNLLLSSSMDKTFCLIDIEEKKVLNKWKNHQKFVVDIKWNQNGNFFATASYDHTVCIFSNCYYENQNQKRNLKNYELVKKLEFNANPESIAFQPFSKNLIVAIRESNNLRIVSLEKGKDFEIEKFNMNSNLDDHVSFSAMNIKFSKNGKYLLVSTDHHRLLLYKLGYNTPLRIFYGATNDIYSQPRNSWHPSGRYVYSTSQDHKIYCWSVHDAKIVEKLEGHTSNVRDISHHPTENLLGSVSFDKSLKIWEHKN